MQELTVHIWYKHSRGCNPTSKSKYGHAAISIPSTIHDEENQTNIEISHYISFFPHDSFRSPDDDKVDYTDKKDRYQYNTYHLRVSDADINTIFQKLYAITGEENFLDVGNDTYIPQLPQKNKTDNLFNYCSNAFSRNTYNCTTLTIHLLPESLELPLTKNKFVWTIMAYLLLSAMGGYNAGVASEIRERQNQQEIADDMISIIALAILLIQAGLTLSSMCSPIFYYKNCIINKCSSYFENPNFSTSNILFAMHVTLTIASALIRYSARTEKVFEETQEYSTLIGLAIGISSTILTMCATQCHSLYFDNYNYIIRPEGLNTMLELKKGKDGYINTCILDNGVDFIQPEEPSVNELPTP